MLFGSNHKNSVANPPHIHQLKETTMDFLVCKLIMNNDVYSKSKQEISSPRFLFLAILYIHSSI